MSCGRSAPAFEVEGVLGQGPVLPANTQSRGTAGHDGAPRLPAGLAPLGQRRLQDLQRRLTLRTRTTGRFERGRDRPDILHVGAPGFWGGVDGPQPPRDVPGQPCEAVGRRPPFCAARWRGSAAGPSPKASAMRRPGGGRGPPGSSCKLPRTAAPSARPLALGAASPRTAVAGGASPGSTVLRRSAIAPLERPGRAVDCRARTTSRARARPPRTVRRLCTWARLSAARTGGATSRRKCCAPYRCGTPGHAAARPRPHASGWP